jgi:hypothetical protein
MGLKLQVDLSPPAADVPTTGFFRGRFHSWAKESTGEKKDVFHG